MKRFLSLLLVAVLLCSVFSVSSAEYPLSENEQRYVGAWTMYANNGKGTVYSNLLTFLDSGEVVQSTQTFKDGTLSSNNKSSGQWCGFTSETIVFTLAGTDMAAMIKDDGYLYLYFFKGLTLCGVYSRCESMNRFLGWD